MLLIGIIGLNSHSFAQDVKYDDNRLCRYTHKVTNNVVINGHIIKRSFSVYPVGSYGNPKVYHGNKVAGGTPAKQNPIETKKVLDDAERFLYKYFTGPNCSNMNTSVYTNTISRKQKEAEALDILVKNQRPLGK